MSRSSTVVVAGPLALFAVEIDERLTALGYAQSTRREVQLQLSALSRWLQEIGLPAAKLTEVVVEHFREDCVARGITCPRLALGRLVTMLRSAGALVDDRPVQPATKRDLLVAGYVDCGNSFCGRTRRWTRTGPILPMFVPTTRPNVQRWALSPTPAASPRCTPRCSTPSEECD
jgi:hypothetical protein